jgi:methionine aminotransferase
MLPAITLAGGVPVPVEMEVDENGYSVPWDEGRGRGHAAHPPDRHQQPHNPTGSILRRADLDAAGRHRRGTDILILSDEVYEHMVYDGQRTNRSAAIRCWRSAPSSSRASARPIT